MQRPAQPLPDDPDVLREMIARLSDQLTDSERERAAQAEQIQTHADTLQQREQRIEQLLETIELLRRKRFGPSTERVPDAQQKLFDEAELEALIGELEAEAQAHTGKGEKNDENPPAEPKAPKQKPVRRPLPPHLTRVERIIDLPQDEKAAMGEDWTFIGYDTSEQLAVIPRQHYVIQYKRAKYVPRDEEVPGAEVGVKIAPRPEQILPKSIAHSSLLASLCTAKFVDALPLYRQEKAFARDGIELSRQTMASLLIQLRRPLAPVVQAMRRALYRGALVQIDETPVQVLKEPGRKAEDKSYMWVFRGGPPHSPVLLFHYAPSRGAEVPKQFLFPDQDGPPDPDSPLSFYIQSDGYSAYNVLAARAEVLGHAGCWAHVRRKFVDAANARKNPGAAHQMIAYIGKLYAIERQIRGKAPEVRKAARKEHSAPILETIKAWLDNKVSKTLPKGLLGKAIGYALGQWPLLTTFLEDGRVEIDNNLAENAIRPFVIGRKNWLFSGSPRGAEASAILYSLVETAKANGLEPWAYLNYLFERLPGAKTPEAVEALLPFNLKSDDLKL
jgi:transposase